MNLLLPFVVVLIAYTLAKILKISSWFALSRFCFLLQFSLSTNCIYLACLTSFFGVHDSGVLCGKSNPESKKRYDAWSIHILHYWGTRQALLYLRSDKIASWDSSRQKQGQWVPPCQCSAYHAFPSHYSLHPYCYEGRRQECSCLYNLFPLVS